MIPAFTANTGTGVEDGLSGSASSGSLGFKSGHQWKRGSEAIGVNKGVSVLVSIRPCAFLFVPSP